MAARVYVGYVNDEIACFSAILPLPNLVDTFRISRSVVLPDFQGIGFGIILLEFIGKYYIENNGKLELISENKIDTFICIFELWIFFPFKSKP